MSNGSVKVEENCDSSPGASTNKLESGDSPTKKRHIIKGKNVKQLDEKSSTSPLVKSLSFFGKLSKKGKGKTKKLYDEYPVEPRDNQEDSRLNAKQQTNSLRNLSSHLDEVPQEKSVTKQVDSAISTKTSKKDGKTVKSTKKRNSKSTVRSHTLTEYYPVRRSSRKTGSVLEKEQTDITIQLIKDKCEDGLSVVEFNGKGRGVVAKRAFKKGSFVVEYAGDLIDWTEAKHREEEYSKDPSVGCYMYYFVHKNSNYCVDATTESGRLGRLLNHSRKNPNCKTKLITMDDVDVKGSKPRLIIIAKRDINAGEELCYDYGDRDKETLRSHPWLKST